MAKGECPKCGMKFEGKDEAEVKKKMKEHAEKHHS
ncbi:MAG: DUF1059 domain-containing protein [Promethearchaeota archaeon]|jgi:predicted small metal-binding protein|nr:MAG: DUF1059 domain-containing protein [Candidatus Lokiarchaeota archaeon]